MTKPYIKLIPIGLYGSIGILILLLAFMFLPVSSTSSSALGENETMTVGLNTKTTAYLYSTITLSTSGQVDIDITPKAAGALGIGKAEVKVATNNTTGYSMFLSTVDQTNRLNQMDSNLQYQGGRNEYYIDTLPSSTTAEDYLASSQNLNTWGYALTSGEASNRTEYHGMKSPSGEQIYSTKGTSSNDSYNLNVAVAVDTTLPAGGYRNGLVVTAVANPIILSGFNQIYYMQDMTPAVCESAAMESTAQLVDKRDNKLYWVAKLKDGNCWMVQNLAYTITQEMIDNNSINSTNTDLHPNNAALTGAGQLYTDETTGITYWNNNDAVTYKPSVTETEIPVQFGEFNLAATRSFNFGNIVLVSPTESSNCGDFVHGDSITSCQWLKDTTGMTAANDANFATETSSVEGNVYDAHYLIGSYYSWNTVTAGTGGELSSSTNSNVNPDYLKEAPSSLCPAGWKLPASGRYYSSDRNMAYPYEREDSFTNLLSAYGYPEGKEATGWAPGGNGYTYTSLTGDGRTRPDYTPMYFVRAGNIIPNSNAFRMAGQDANYWSGTAGPYSTNHYGLGFDLVTIRPANVDSGNYIFTARCLAR